MSVQSPFVFFVLFQLHNKPLLLLSLHPMANTHHHKEDQPAPLKRTVVRLRLHQKVILPPRRYASHSNIFESAGLFESQVTVPRSDPTTLAWDTGNQTLLCFVRLASGFLTTAGTTTMASVWRASRLVIWQSDPLGIWKYSAKLAICPTNVKLKLVQFATHLQVRGARKNLKKRYQRSAVRKLIPSLGAMESVR